MEQFIKKTLDLLKENPEWERRYAGYLTEVWNRSDKWQKPFRKSEGLSLYTSLATRNEKIYFLRFKGQNVGKISVRRNGNSGHADPHTLEQLFMLMDAGMIIPMHTSNPVKFLEKFSGNDWQIRLIEDGETIKKTIGRRMTR